MSGTAGGEVRLRRHYPRWLTIKVTTNERGNLRADVYANNNGHWIGGAACSGSQGELEEHISKMLDDRRRFADC